MSNNRKSGKKQTAKAPQKKTNFLPILAVAAVVICIAVVLLVNRNGNSNGNGDIGREVNGADTTVSSETLNENAGADREISGAVTISSGESLVIPTADITTDASFFPVKVDGTRMEVIAVKDSEGNFRFL